MDLKRRIHDARGPLFGMMVTSLGSSDVVEAAAQAALDFVIFDGEHAPITEPGLAAQCEVATLRGISPIVRVAAADPDHASRALDLGAVGIMVPRCKTLAEAAEVAAACYYPPLGDRGFSSRSIGQRLHRLRTPGAALNTRSSLLESQNQTTVVIVQLETEGLLRDLAAQPVDSRIDVLFVGARDLVVSQGRPDLELDAVGIRSMLPPPPRDGHTPALGAVAAAGPAAPWVEQGFTFLVLGHDTEFFSAGLQRRLATLDMRIPTA